MPHGKDCFCAVFIKYPTISIPDGIHRCRDLAASVLYRDVSEGSKQKTKHRKELIKPEQDSLSEQGVEGTSSITSSSHSEGMHAGQDAMLREEASTERAAEDLEAKTQHSYSLSERSAEKDAESGETEDKEDASEEDSPVMNREETEAAAIEGLRDALRSTDKEASVDIKVEISKSPAPICICPSPRSDNLQIVRVK